MAVRTSFLVVALVAAPACTGPALHLENPDDHTVFLDGVQTKAGTKPFRYYGSTRWDALPADRDGKLDLAHRPTSQHVEIPPPANPWLFPLDFPLELLSRLVAGRPDTTTTVRVQGPPPEVRTEEEMVKSELPQLTERAREARASR